MSSDTLFKKQSKTQRYTVYILFKKLKSENDFFSLVLV